MKWQVEGGNKVGVRYKVRGEKLQLMSLTSLLSTLPLHKQGLSVKNSSLKGLLCSSPQARVNIESLEKEALSLFTPW